MTRPGDYVGHIKWSGCSTLIYRSERLLKSLNGVIEMWQIKADDIYFDIYKTNWTDECKTRDINFDIDSFKIKKVYVQANVLRNKGEGLLACDLKVSVKRIARFLLIAIINFGWWAIHLRLIARVLFITFAPRREHADRWMQQRDILVSSLTFRFTNRCNKPTHP